MILLKAANLSELLASISVGHPLLLVNTLSSSIHTCIYMYVVCNLHLF